SDVSRKQANIDRTWSLLRNANRGVINNTVAEGNIALGGWLALTRAYNQNLSNPAQLSQAIQQ
ncbi:LppC, partial [Pasteurella multocida subsp. multocida str. Anand1_buffalo]